MSYVWIVVLVLLTPLWIVLALMLLQCLLTAAGAVAGVIGAIEGWLRYGRKG